MLSSETSLWGKLRSVHVTFPKLPTTFCGKGFPRLTIISHQLLLLQIALWGLLHLFIWYIFILLFFQGAQGSIYNFLLLHIIPKTYILWDILDWVWLTQGHSVNFIVQWGSCRSHRSYPNIYYLLQHTNSWKPGHLIVPPTFLFYSYRFCKIVV